MKKALFIISLRYPLINAINIKINELTDKHADIILDDTIRDDSYQLAENLRKSQIFDNVFFTNPSGYKGLKIFFQNFNINNSFLKACHGSYKNLKLKYLYKTNPLAYLNNVVISGGMIDLSIYDDVYICSQTEISWICLNYLAKNNYIENINLIEEGLSIYLKNDIINKYGSLYPNQKIISYLYEPDLLTYENFSENISLKKIPKLSIKNYLLITKLNQIFSYTNVNDLNNKIIFFEQVFEPMPNYLNNIFLKLILFNTYKKHLKKNNLFLGQLNIINNLMINLKKHRLLNHFYIKLHPRTQYHIENLNSFIIGDKSNKISIPWEIYCLNQQFENNLWITMYSSSVLNKAICFQEIGNIKFVFLYKCNTFFHNEARNLEIFYTKFSKKYCNHIIIPNNIDELNEEINSKFNKL